MKRRIAPVVIAVASLFVAGGVHSAAQAATSDQAAALSCIRIPLLFGLQIQIGICT